MTLTESERNSPLWAKLREGWEADLKTLRARNDDPNNVMTELATARLRGRIDEIKRNLERGSSKPKPDVE
jgi:hypothetical protein